ncbi:COG4104 Uncharacterized conserved protein [uncultured Caudovirales phage]|uniref:COG4104 Uncharacterized conserved protein n=1 Tax=uncultured Caudovirales phage TaxID=2100421 RepID=A0A6J5KPG8_9CAUD|nr:COG4104 Uncharacterized conserved protein [uncultured Caudovirales phage]
MAAAARATVDIAGGIILPGSPNVFVNGFPAVRAGDHVQNHGGGNHAAATVVGGSRTVRVNGRPMIKLGDFATCGHPVTGGSPNVFVDDAQVYMIFLNNYGTVVAFLDKNGKIINFNIGS